MNNPYDVLIDTYLENNVGIDNYFLTKQLSDGLQENIKHLKADNLMAYASIGNQQVVNNEQKMRGDKIYWMDKSHDNPFEQEFLQQIENFIDRLNSTCYTGINGYEFHYAEYGQGTEYKRHKDQFKNDSNRKYSLINYLNNNWVEQDGGQLLIFDKQETKSIEPHAQKAVFFKSDEIEHQVATSNKNRMSITGWLKRM